MRKTYEDSEVEAEGLMQGEESGKGLKLRHITIFLGKTMIHC